MLKVNFNERRSKKDIPDNQHEMQELHEFPII